MKLSKYIFPKYRITPINVSEEQNIIDLKKIIQADLKSERNKDTMAFDLWREMVPYIRAIDAADPGIRTYEITEKVYLDTPENRLFLEGNPEFSYLDYIYKIDTKYFVRLGVHPGIKISASDFDSSGNVALFDRPGLHKRGVKRFDPESQVEGLDFALQNPSKEKSEFIWNKLLTLTVT